MGTAAATLVTRKSAGVVASVRDWRPAETNAGRPWASPGFSLAGVAGGVLEFARGTTMLTAGAATLGTIGRHSIGATATAATGGASPYGYQWQYQWPRDGIGWRNASGPGATTLAATIEGLGPSALYQVRLEVTDADAATAASNTLTASTRGLGWFAGLWRRRE